MIDVEKEIEEFCTVDLEQEAISSHGELLKTINVFSDIFKRLGKEQFKYLQQLEEIILMLEDNKETEREYREIKHEVKIKKKKVEGLLETLLELVDSLEDIYRYAHQSGQISWKEQMMMQWIKAVQLLEKQGITLIQGAGHLFNVQLHKAREVKEHSEYPHGYILEVTRNGYMYKGMVIRKADVIVNKTE